ncbi:hypothetical protein IEC_01782 [Bacillus toyonensis]|uniref:hypothetical protein n=1 Tax=Bacillus toyonensis TaxID=155322 RepID=UPI000278E17A|nr:hypothetical protein [Bacillus toyonensis]EJQ38824.1 hypothetical protein IEC_01782 [Bacillus toyonensis]KAB2361352.1 hypothetical protein F8503_05530 [Bacillus toyonensis]HDR8522271.1 hypothetical protein [Bacillus toyonensis]
MHWEQYLGDASYDELYETTCPQTICTPFGCTDYETPCIKSREWTAYFTLVVDYPDDVSDEQQAVIISCAIGAVAVAYATAVSVYTVEGPIYGAEVAALDAANAAIVACRETFELCISGLPSEIKDNIGIAVTHYVEQTFRPPIICIPTCYPICYNSSYKWYR